jgi:hypothetical protein
VHVEFFSSVVHAWFASARCHLLPLCVQSQVTLSLPQPARYWQASLLLEADSFAAWVQGGAESWAEEMEALLTEELDGRLRAHRPRAGRIEEEVRLCTAQVHCENLGWTTNACN